jgi:hypothetical protein
MDGAKNCGGGKILGETAISKEAQWCVIFCVHRLPLIA